MVGDEKIGWRSVPSTGSDSGPNWSTCKTSDRVDLFFLSDSDVTLDPQYGGIEPSQIPRFCGGQSHCLDDSVAESTFRPLLRLVYTFQNFPSVEKHVHATYAHMLCSSPCGVVLLLQTGQRSDHEGLTKGWSLSQPEFFF